MIGRLLAVLAILFVAASGGALAQPSALSVDSRLLLPYPSCPDPSVPGDVRYGYWDKSANGGRGGWGCSDYLNGRFSDVNVELGRIEAAITDRTPVLSISDATASAADGTMTFRVRLFNNSGGATASFSYQTADYTARGGIDFAPLSGSASVSDSTTITVPLLGADHPNRVSFYLRLTGAAGADIADGEGVGIIAPAAPPQLSISDTYVNSNAGSATLIVTRSGASHAVTTVAWRTVDGTARAGTDYTAASGTLTFPAGALWLPVSVPLTAGVPTGIRGFRIVLSDPTGAQIADGSGDVFIVTPEVIPETIRLPEISVSILPEPISHFRGTGDIPFPVTPESPNASTGGWTGPFICFLDESATRPDVMSDALVRQIAESGAYWYAQQMIDRSERATHAAMSIGGATRTICDDDERVHLDRHPEGGNPLALWTGQHPALVPYPDGHVGMSVSEFKQMAQNYSQSLYNSFYINTTESNKYSWFSHFYYVHMGHISYPFLSTFSPPLPTIYEDAIPFVRFSQAFELYYSAEPIGLTRQRIAIYRNCTLDGAPPRDPATHCPWPRP